MQKSKWWLILGLGLGLLFAVQLTGCFSSPTDPLSTHGGNGLEPTPTYTVPDFSGNTLTGYPIIW